MMMMMIIIIIIIYYYYYYHHHHHTFKIRHILAKRGIIAYTVLMAPLNMSYTVSRAEVPWRNTRRLRGHCQHVSR